MNLKINKKVDFRPLGTIDYPAGWDYQEKVFAEILSLKVQNRALEASEQLITPNILVFCEHPHVYTLGKSGKIDHLLLDEAALEEKNASFHKINRGGDITYHGPGQLVGYPIFDLENFYTDIHRYMRDLEEVIIQTLAHFDILASRLEGLTGVWIGGGDTARKICAMGVKSSRWVTMHGFALNVNTDLDYFGNIVPCGIDDKAVTSMAQETGKMQDMAAIAEVCKVKMSEVFGFEYAK